MADTTTLGDRMKNSYENRGKQFLTRRTNTIIRLDGKSFSRWTKGLVKPFDEGLIEDMQEVTKFLCENIQGAKCGYTQSDEITILLTDYDSLDTSMWFDGNVQKITSISASLATAKFNELRQIRHMKNFNISVKGIGEISLEYCLNNFKLAYFDSRVFQIPEKEEVVNCFLWRQRDAEKNSVAMLAQSLYSHSELHKKNGSDMQEMCFQKGHNWNNLNFSKKRGSFIIKNTYVDGNLLGLRNDKGNLVVEYFTDTEKYAKFDIDLEEWVDLPKQSLRTKWEVIETPFFGKERESILKLMPQI